jgi:hypothetical protein
MTKTRQAFSFSVAIKLWLLIFLSGLSVRAMAQEKSVAGIVFDKSSDERIAIVNVLNVVTGVSAYNNLKGEFTLNARPGDVLIFTKQDYHSDTIRVQNYTPIAIYMIPIATQLKEVNIKDTLLNPEARLEATKRDYTKVYGTLAERDLLNVGPGGAGLSIDALYNIFSRSGRNAERLRGVIQRDYYQNVIDYRFNRTLVNRITGLKDTQLTDFMQKYRPGYYFVISASDYDFIISIRNNYKRYLRRPKAYALPALTGK